MLLLGLPLVVDDTSAGGRFPLHGVPHDRGLADLDVVTGPTCGCGHSRRAHEHYRRGADCGLCRCDSWSASSRTRPVAAAGLSRARR